jgi:hypothetical protein
MCVKDSTKSEKSLCPSMTELWKTAQEKVGDKFQEVLKKVHYESGDNIEELLSRCQMSEILLSDKAIKDFVETTEKAVVEKCRFLKSDTNLEMHETFLRRIARRSTKLERAKIFTTNYDTCFEQAARNTGFIFVDGFSHTLPQEFDSSYFDYDLVKRSEYKETPDYIPNVFHLYKLHGSVDWEQKNNNRVFRNPETSKPLLIYPRNTKFETSYKPPFIDLMGRFQSCLRKPSTSLLVIGCGFNDNHIAQPILSALRSNTEMKMMVVGSDLKKPDNPAIKIMTQLIQNGDPRICLLKTEFEKFVPWIPDIVATTEEEKYRARIQTSYGPF